MSYETLKAKIGENGNKNISHKILVLEESNKGLVDLCRAHAVRNHALKNKVIKLKEYLSLSIIKNHEMDQQWLKNDAEIKRLRKVVKDLNIAIATMRYNIVDPTI